MFLAKDNFGDSHLTKSSVGSNARLKTMVNIMVPWFHIQSNQSGTTTLDVMEKWSFQAGGRSRQVRFAGNSMADWDFHKLLNGLSRQGGLSRQVSL